MVWPERAADLGTPSETERRQVLVARSARFAGVFLRWMDSNAPDGLTFARTELLGLLRDDGPAMMKDLANSLGVTARNMTAMVDAMEASGLVVRRPHPTDRRATLVGLTPRGESVADGARRSSAGRFGRIFDDLSRTEQQQFLESITRLLAAMEPPT